MNAPAEQVCTEVEIRCRKCGFDQFRLVAEMQGSKITGNLELTCVRCGGHEFGGIDPNEEKRLRGAAVKMMPL